MIEDLTFLEQGKYTQTDEIVRHVAERLKKSNKTRWRAISDYVTNDLNHNNSNKSYFFRRRTASKIIKSEYETGCTDVALVFITLSRELGIPTRYVETLDKDWLLDKNAKGIQGHIFVDIFIDGSWRAYEPKRGFTENNDYLMNGRRYVEVGKGLDFSEVYIKENGVYRPKPTNLQSLDEAIRIFKPSALSK